MIATRIPSLVALPVLFASVLAAQTPPEDLPQPTRGTQLPLSGRTVQPGSVETIQTPTAGGPQTVNTINSTVQVTGAYGGSVLSAPAAGALLNLSLDEALRRGLEYNLGAVDFTQATRQAQALARVSRSNLLPNVTSDLLVAEQQTDLAALGFTSIPFPPGLSFPTVIGPYHYFDLRAGVSQSVFDLTRLRNYRAAQEDTRSVRFAAEDARDLIALAVTGGYLEVIASTARIASTRAQVDTALATYQQAVDRHNAGLNARIDVTRTEVELRTQQQRLIAVENQFAKQKIVLARLIGLPPGQEFNLTDTLPFAPLEHLTLDQALQRAYTYRADLKAADAQVHAAETARQAAVAERYPTVEVAGDYGVIGSSPVSSHGTFGVSGSVRFPIFQGGRVQADVEQADAALQQRRAEYSDTRGRIDADVRSAFLDLNSAANEVSVAEGNRTLAAETLTQARDRFTAGVADTLEVVQAQEAVASAEQDYIAALFSHNLAKASLARAMGQAGANMKQFLGRP